MRLLLACLVATLASCTQPPKPNDGLILACRDGSAFVRDQGRECHKGSYFLDGCTPLAPDAQVKCP